MIRVLGVLLVVAVYIWFIVDVVRTPRAEVRSLGKFPWLLVVVLIPLVGGALWLWLGRAWPARGGRFGWRSQPVAPDDDPAFIKRIGDDAWAKRMQRRREDPGA
jgi:hypothetical protein